MKTIDKEVKSTYKDININDVDILQRDRRFQYTSYMFKNITKDITHSMSRPGHCPDNSPIQFVSLCSNYHFSLSLYFFRDL